MYYKNRDRTFNIENFELLPGTKLSSENRWVIMAEVIPWEEFIIEGLFQPTLNNLFFP
ncbi:MAG: hypothetical protein AB4062_15075 [Crocosphaera sp.]